MNVPIFLPTVPSAEHFLCVDDHVLDLGTDLVLKIEVAQLKVGELEDVTVYIFPDVLAQIANWLVNSDLSVDSF